MLRLQTHYEVYTRIYSALYHVSGEEEKRVVPAEVSTSVSASSSLPVQRSNSNTSSTRSTRTTSTSSDARPSPSVARSKANPLSPADQKVAGDSEDLTAEVCLKIRKNIPKRLRHLLFHVNAFCGQAGHLEKILVGLNANSPTLNFAFSSAVQAQTEHFFADLCSSLESLNASDTVAFIKTKLGVKTMLGDEFVSVFIAQYAPRLEALHRLMKTELQQMYGRLLAENANLGGFKEAFLQFSNESFTRAAPTTVLMELRFSQKDHNPNFSKNNGIRDEKVTTACKSVKQVAQELKAAVLSTEELPVTIFASDVRGKWYSENTRTFTALSIAGLFPTRLVPRLPTKEVADRPASLNADDGDVIEAMGDKKAKTVRLKFPAAAGAPEEKAVTEKSGKTKFRMK